MGRMPLLNVLNGLPETSHSQARRSPRICIRRSVALADPRNASLRSVRRASQAEQRALRLCADDARRTTGHPGCGFPVAPHKVQKPKPATARIAHLSVDQPAFKGAPNLHKPTTLHSKFMKQGVAKSLTRSAPYDDFFCLTVLDQGRSIPDNAANTAPAYRTANLNASESTPV